MDLSFFLEPPEFSVKAVLTVEALAPLSMSTAHPGTYYRSQRAPTDAMLYGLLENAMGIHLPAEERKKTLKRLRKTAKRELGRGHELKETPWIKGRSDAESGSGFVSVLQHHLIFDTAFFPEVKVTSFDDLWARHVHRADDYEGGSKHNDARITGLYNRLKDKEDDAKFVSSKASANVIEPEEIEAAIYGHIETPKVRQKELKRYFPQYYTSPTPREYVLPQSSYRYRIRTTETLAQQVQVSLKDPAGPLYLGNSDGWVEAHLDILST
jgi:CRISPR-associated protein Cas5